LYKISSSELSRGLNRQAGFMRELPDNNMLNRIPGLEQIRAEQFRESSGHLKLNLIYFNLLILILSAGLAYFFARRTLAPIKETLEIQNSFTADASYELRTPLAAIKSEIEVALRDKKLGLATAKKTLKSNLEEVEKLESLTNALLKLSQYQEEGKNIFEKVSLEEVIIEGYEKIESLARKKSINFNTKLENLYIQGDKASLIELIVILLDNAIKYSPQKSKITIRLKKKNHQAEIRIIDRGIGIKSSDLPYIFNRFYRADLSRQRQLGSGINGYGLGLAIAKKIIELNRGSIEVKSKIGAGTTFIIKFPKI